jgi:hypothetical protein
VETGLLILDKHLHIVAWACVAFHLHALGLEEAGEGGFAHMLARQSYRFQSKTPAKGKLVCAAY